MNQMQQRQQTEVAQQKARNLAPGLSQLLGIPEDQAVSMLQADPMIQRELIKNLGMAGQSQQMAQLLGLDQGGMQQGFEQQQMPMQQMQGQMPAQTQQGPSIEDQLANAQQAMRSNTPLGSLLNKPIAKLPAIKPDQQLMGMQKQPQTTQQNTPQQQPIDKGKTFGKPLSPTDILNVAKYRQGEKKLEAEEKRHIQKMEFEKQKFASKEQRDAFSANKEIIHDVYEKAKGAEENTMRLEKMKKLVEKGNLSSPLMYNILKGIPIVKNFNIETMLNPDSEEFQKLSNDFIKNAKAIFGARVTEGEINMFLKTVPTLSQSNEGKMRVIQNLELFAQGDKIRKAALNEVLKEHKGIPPYNLEQLITEKVAPIQEKLHKRFIANMSSAPASQGLTQELSRIAPGSETADSLGSGNWLLNKLSGGLL